MEARFAQNDRRCLAQPSACSRSSAKEPGRQLASCPTDSHVRRWRILTLPWTRPSPYRKREIIQGANDAKTYARPMPANARAILIDALRDAHRWLDVLLSDPQELKADYGMATSVGCAPALR
jgi:hypothetical protein